MPNFHRKTHTASPHLASKKPQPKLRPSVFQQKTLPFVRFGENNLKPKQGENIKKTPSKREISKEIEKNKKIF